MKRSHGWGYVRSGHHMFLVSDAQVCHSWVQWGWE
jgi:hypothetical protein